MKLLCLFLFFFLRFPIIPNILLKKATCYWSEHSGTIGHLVLTGYIFRRRFCLIDTNKFVHFFAFILVIRHLGRNLSLNWRRIHKDV
jgi:hypothetical protein